MKKRSILTAICALVSALSIGVLSACGTSDNTPTDSSTGDSSITAPPVENPETPEEEREALTIASLTSEVFPYVDAAKNFLLAGEGADVSDYYVSGLKNPQVPLQIEWEYDGTGTRKFVVEYATKADYSDSLSVEASATQRSVNVYNLYKAANYHLRITAVDSKGNVLNQAETQFQTTALGPRVMNVEGIYNVRDLGGYETSFGKTLVQGIAYRGGMLYNNASGNSGDLTAAGKKTMSEELGIKAELDFRNAAEAGVKIEDGSSIPGATLTYITSDGYQNIFSEPWAESYRQVFSYLSNKDNYPLYYHCTAGADRTGSVSYILHAFLGVSELECHQDFAFTSFSIYGLRGSYSTDSGNSGRYRDMVSMLKEYDGATLQEKAENYLLSIGVTKAELENIKAIFFGEVEIDAPYMYNPNEA